MTRQSISIDDDLLEILKKKAVESERSLSKEIAYRLKMSLRLEDDRPERKEGEV